jgi:hypothetical protein
MATSKRKTARTAPPENLGKPSKWRLQHGGVGPAVRDADPDTGTPVQHHRTVDTLGVMLEHNTITPEMHEAGCIFRTQFRTASLNGMRTTQLIRVPGGSGDTLTERQASARCRIAAVMEVVGGPDTATGSCLWHVVGLECSVREWAIRRGWNGKPIPPPQGQGILIGALGILAAHCGLVRRGADNTVGQPVCEPA